MNDIANSSTQIFQVNYKIGKFDSLRFEKTNKLGSGNPLYTHNPVSSSQLAIATPPPGWTSNFLVRPVIAFLEPHTLRDLARTELESKQPSLILR